MANDKNLIIFTGNIGSDVEMKTIGSGTCLCKFRVGCNEEYTDKNGAKQKSTEWFTCELWGKYAEIVGPILAKGQKVLIDGKIKTTMSEKNGEKKYFTKVVCSSVMILTPKGNSTSSASNQTKKVAAPVASPSDSDQYEDDSDIPF